MGTDGIVSGEGMNGTKCLRIINRQNGNEQIAYQSVDLVRGQSYTLKCYCKAVGQMLLYAQLRFLQQDGNQGFLYSPILVSGPNSGYAQYTWQFTMPANAKCTIAEIRIHGGGWPNMPATLWVDDVELVGDDSATSNPVAPSYPALPSGLHDYVWSGDFYNQFPWISMSGVSFLSGSNESRDGAGCLLFSNSQANGSPIHTYQNLSCSPGDNHTLSLWVKRKGNMEVWCAVICTLSGQTISIGTASLLSKTFETYTRHDFTLAIPANSTSHKLYIYAKGEAGESSSAYVDDVVLLGPAVSVPPNLLQYADVHLTTGIHAGLNVRQGKSTSSSTIGLWPHGRRALVLATDDPDWYECRYRGEVGYVNASYLRNFAPAPDGNGYGQQYDTPNRLEEIGEQEVNATHDSHPQFYHYGMQKYKDANQTQLTKWCHMFADWLSGHSFWGLNPSAVFPYESNCKDGVRWFLMHAEFFFVDASHKATVHNVSGFGNLVPNGNLTQAEINFRARAGDYVYFYDPSEQAEVAKHVAVVVAGYSSGSIRIVEGNAGGNTVRARDIAKSDFGTEKIFGFGRPAEYVYG